jgi:hypothetical protein
MSRRVGRDVRYEICEPSGGVTQPSQIVLLRVLGGMLASAPFIAASLGCSEYYLPLRVESGRSGPIPTLNRFSRIGECVSPGIRWAQKPESRSRASISASTWSPVFTVSEWHLM